MSEKLEYNVNEIRYWVEWKDKQGKDTCRLCETYEKACVLAKIINDRHLKDRAVKLTAVALFGTV